MGGDSAKNDYRFLSENLPGKMAGTERNGMRKKVRSGNVPLRLQEHQKGILQIRNGMERNAGIPQNVGSKIAGTKKGMHNLACDTGH